jgi:hypothetical protein
MRYHLNNIVANLFLFVQVVGSGRQDQHTRQHALVPDRPAAARTRRNTSTIRNSRVAGVKRRSGTAAPASTSAAIASSLARTAASTVSDDVDDLRLKKEKKKTGQSGGTIAGIVVGVAVRLLTV